MRFNYEQIEREILQAERQIKELEKSIDHSEGLHDYSFIIHPYLLLMENILVYIYEKHGLVVDERNTSIYKGDSGKIERSGLMSYSSHSCCDFMPSEIKKYIEQMRLIRNAAVRKATFLTYSDYVGFKELFLLFKEWFILQYSKESPYSSMEKIEIELIKSEVEKSLNELKNQIIEYERALLEEQITSYKIKIKELEEENNRLKKEFNKREQIEGVLSNVESKMQAFENIAKMILGNQINFHEENQNQFRILNEKMSQIHKELRNIASLITSYQEDASRLIKMYEAKEGDEKYEQIISDFTEKIIDKITNRFSIDYLSDEYRKEHFEVKTKFDETWEMLSDVSRRFLITARVLYKQMIPLKDIADYSGICILITKALEEEMQKRFFKGFVEYLQNKYPLNKPNNYIQWHTSMYNL